MTNIKFARDYGYAPASPFWLVWHQDSFEECGRPSMTKHVSREEAEAEASTLAIRHPGRSFHVLAAMAEISTSPDVVGRRFDPTRTPPMAPDPAPEVRPTFLDGAPEPVTADEEPI